MKESDFRGELMFFSAIAGAVAAMVKTLVHQAFHLLNVPMLYGEITAYLTHGHLKVENFSEWIFSAFADMTLGALFGIVLGFWLKSSRPKYHWWIGLGYGFGIWFITLSFANLTKIIEKTMTTPISLFSHLSAMIIYGLFFILACRFWEPLRSRIEMSDDYG
ncbi:MAG: hypothetical protein ACM3YE_06575 [Bacteroidota bacterium]